MRSVESSAKTMEEAISLGLEKLEASIADVTIDILDEGSKGFLGILGSKPVVVRLTVREDVEEEDDVLSSVNLESAMKAPEKKNSRKRNEKAKAEKAPKKAAEEKKNDVFLIQGIGEHTVADITELCKADYKNGSRKRVASIDIYVKAEHGELRAYYVVNGNAEGKYIVL